MFQRPKQSHMCAAAFVWMACFRSRGYGCRFPSISSFLVLINVGAPESFYRWLHIHKKMLRIRIQYFWGSPRLFRKLSPSLSPTKHEETLLTGIPISIPLQCVTGPLSLCLFDVIFGSCLAHGYIPLGQQSFFSEFCISLRNCTA